MMYNEEMEESGEQINVCRNMLVFLGTNNPHSQPDARRSMPEQFEIAW
jgi:hypothetical protein